MDIIKIADEKLESMRDIIIDNINSRVRSLLREGSQKILFTGHTITNPYRADGSYLFLMEIIISADSEVIAETSEDIMDTSVTIPVPLQMIRTFELMEILINLVRDQSWCIVKSPDIVHSH